MQKRLIILNKSVNSLNFYSQINVQKDDIFFYRKSNI